MTLQRQLRMPPIEWCRVNDDAWREHFDGATIYDDLLPDEMRALARVMHILSV